MKKKMRVLLAAAFAGVLALGLVGCSGGGSGDGEGGWNLPTKTTTEASNRNGAAMRAVENRPRKSAA